ncbi:Fibronectin/fibrinogen-binding protein [hydrothermal vent metagenome]|uniref:Fibronectin/fibrinogen-binding protein n=1 Tax=hydrothermal vent metagenome TaxID=652676 RepID=A0A1W1BEY2_9ZZZZ
MKLSHLKQITEYLKQFKKIVAAYRVDDNLIKLVFDKDEEIYFDMRKSNSKIFKTKEPLARSKIYNAPFDVMLVKRFNRSNIEKVDLVNGDKILRFTTALASAYKKERTLLQFEFTGKHTNVIILDENETVLEALRHVDIFSSFREVKVGQKLLPLPKPNFTPKEFPIADVEEFLYKSYEEQHQKELENLKKQKIALLQKRLDKLTKRYNKLENEKDLLDQSKRAEHYGNLVLSNLHTIKPYTKTLTLKDYNGEDVVIELEKLYAQPKEIAQEFFRRSKKLKQRAKNLHIERESLSSKIQHLQNFIEAVRNAQNIAKIHLLFPKQQKSKQKREHDSIETFFIEGYKVQLGKNEKGNIELLKSAKARDIWLHLKDRPSTHVIIKTDKQNIPQNVLQTAARLCVEFTTSQKDRFLVDYTPRREVKIQEGANVLYNKYKTIEIDTRE